MQKIITLNADILKLFSDAHSTKKPFCRVHHRVCPFFYLNRGVGMNKSKILTDMINKKVQTDGKIDLSGYRGFAKKILSMSNQEIIDEASLIQEKKSNLEFRSRNFCLYIAQKIIVEVDRQNRANRKKKEKFTKETEPNTPKDGFRKDLKAIS